MNRSELIETLEELAEEALADTEQPHAEADELIASFLIQLGYDDVATAYRSVDKYYA